MDFHVIACVPDPGGPGLQPTAVRCGGSRVAPILPPVGQRLSLCLGQALAARSIGAPSDRGGSLQALGFPITRFSKSSRERVSTAARTPRPDDTAGHINLTP